jgi:hypothetical protein
MNHPFLQYPMNINPSLQNWLTKGMSGLFSSNLKISHGFTTLSEKSITVLAKHIHHELLPAQDEDDDTIPSPVSLALPLLVVEDAIKSVASRNNYGLDGVLGSSKAPASLSVWRWEVKEEYWDWLPKAARDKAGSRLAERHQVGCIPCCTDLILM